MKAVKLRAGDPAPWFAAASSVNPAYHFDTVGGFYSVLCFFGDGGHPAGARIIGDLLAQQAFFSQRQVVFFGISTRAEDQALEKSVLDPVFCKFIRDRDGRVSALYGVLSPEGPGRVDYRPTTFIINPMMQVAAVIPVEDPARHAAAVINACLRLPPVSARNEPAVHAPILRIPQVLTPDECGLLIRLYRQGQQRPSGFVREVDGRTVQLQDDRSRLLQTLGLDKATKKVSEIKAPMPGMVLNILVKAGDSVKKNDPVLVLEAMKMENVIKAPGDAMIATVHAEKGKAVEKGQLLISFA